MQKNIIISLIMEWDRFETIPKLLAVCFPGYCEVNKFLSVAWVVRVAGRHVTPVCRYKGWNNQHVRKCLVFVDLLISVNWTLLKTLPLLHIRERKKTSSRAHYLLFAWHIFISIWQQQQSLTWFERFLLYNEPCHISLDDDIDWITEE